MFGFKNVPVKSRNQENKENVIQLSVEHDRDRQKVYLTGSPVEERKDGGFAFGICKFKTLRVVLTDMKRLSRKKLKEEEAKILKEIDEKSGPHYEAIAHYVAANDFEMI